MAATDITTYLWFDTEALDEARFYVDLFPGSRMGEISYYRADAQRQPVRCSRRSSNCSAAPSPP